MASATSVTLQTHASLSRQYDDAAPNWQTKIRRLRYDQAYKDTLERVNYLGLEPGTHVLDAGIGGGALSLALVSGLGTLHVTGVDIAPKMLVEASHTLAGAVASYDSYCADVRALQLPDSVFDGVVSAHLLEHFADPAAALGELYRVLQPGAPLFVMVTRQGLGGLWIKRRWPIYPLTPRTLRQTLEQAGFHKIEQVPVQGPLWCRHLSLAFLAWKV